jgi:uncharacterized protein YukE
MVTSELLRDGYASEASQLAERAGKSIDELRQDVERAAASVLGDDTDALRQAARELDELTRQLENEIARADSASRTNSSAGTAATSPTGQEGEGNRQAGSSAQADSGSTNAPAATLASSSGDQSPQSGSQSQGQRPGEQSGQANASSGQPGESGQPGQSGQSGQQGNASQPGSSPGGQQTAGAGSTSRGQANSPNTSQGRQARAGSGGNRGGIDLASALDAGGGDAGGGGGGGFGPITGADYAQWSDRLRDVEEMIELQDLRAEVARVRDRARLYRQEFKRAGEKPSWAKVKLEISGPLVEVRSQIAEELARRQSNEAQVPADRDPVPAKFAELVRRYYEKLGKSE